MSQWQENSYRSRRPIGKLLQTLQFFIPVSYTHLDVYKRQHLASEHHRYDDCADCDLITVDWIRGKALFITWITVCVKRFTQLSEFTIIEYNQQSCYSDQLTKVTALSQLFQTSAAIILTFYTTNLCRLLSKFALSKASRRRQTFEIATLVDFKHTMHIHRFAMNVPYVRGVIYPEKQTCIK